MSDETKCRTCPMCGEIEDDQSACFDCGSYFDIAGEFIQRPECRIRQLEAQVAALVELPKKCDDCMDKWPDFADVDEMNRLRAA